jgi:hypothetical protein
MEKIHRSHGELEIMLKMCKPKQRRNLGANTKTEKIDNEMVILRAEKD